MTLSPLHTGFQTGQFLPFITLAATVMYRYGHRLHTLTAVPRSTQPSTLHGMVK